MKFFLVAVWSRNLESTGQAADLTQADSAVTFKIINPKPNSGISDYFQGKS
jgi:hypothetical protein